MLTLGFVIDELASLQVTMDTSLLMIADANRRGHRVLYTTLDDMHLHNNHLMVRWHEISWTHESDDLLATEGESFVDRASICDVIVMRKDPPFDQTYLAATYLLDYAGTDVINNPAGIRDANEKLTSMRWPELVAESVVARDLSTLKQTISQDDSDWVVKPLYGYSGHGVFRINHQDSDAQAKLDEATRGGREYILVQRFLEDVYKGDKRVFLLAGEPIGWMNRVPQKGEFIANIHQGATPVAWEPNENDLEIARTVGRDLMQFDMPLVCLDIIGDKLSEVNVTSPSGIPEINMVNGVQLESRMIDYIEARVKARREGR